MVNSMERYKRNLQEIRGIRGPFLRTVFYYFFLAVVMVVFFVSMLESNLERITKQNMHMRIKENSIPHCRASPLARVHMKNFHLN